MKITGGWGGPYPDENAYSMISRLAMYIITPSHYLTRMKLFEKNRPLAQYVVKPLRKSDLERWGMDDGEDFYQRHVLEHSSYPVYGTMLSGNKFDRLEEAINGNELKDGREKYLTRALGCTWMKKNSLYYCPACAEDEMHDYGEPYWHRMHQLPGVEICLKHGVKLHDSGMTIRQINHKFIPLYYVIALQGLGNVESVKDTFTAEVAEDISWLMDHGLSWRGYDNINLMIEYHIQSRSLDMNSVYDHARMMYGKVIERYATDPKDYIKWGSTINPSYLFLIMLTRSIGIRVKEL